MINQLKQAGNYVKTKWEPIRTSDPGPAGQMWLILALVLIAGAIAFIVPEQDVSKCKPIDRNEDGKPEYHVCQPPWDTGIKGLYGRDNDATR